MARARGESDCGWLHATKFVFTQLTILWFLVAVPYAVGGAFRCATRVSFRYVVYPLAAARQRLYAEPVPLLVTASASMIPIPGQKYQGRDICPFCED